VWFLFVTVFGCLNITRINQFQQSYFSVSRAHSFLFFSKLFQNVPGVTCEFPAGVLSDALGKKKMKRGKVLSLQISFRVNLGLFSFDLLGLKVGYFNMKINRKRHSAATFIAVYKWFFFTLNKRQFSLELEKCSAVLHRYTTVRNMSVRIVAYPSKYKRVLGQKTIISVT